MKILLCIDVSQEVRNAWAEVIEVDGSATNTPVFEKVPERTKRYWAEVEVPHPSDSPIKKCQVVEAPK